MSQADVLTPVLQPSSSLPVPPQFTASTYCLSVIICKASGSLSGTGRLQKDNSYYTQIYKALVLVHLLCIKSFVAPVNWRDTRVPGVNNYRVIANSDLLLLHTCVPAHLLLMDCWSNSTGQDGSVMHFASHWSLPCCPGINLPSLLIKWCP